MDILSIINVKGGVGKTTCSINIVGELAKRGYKVLLVDNDPQSNITSTFELSNDYTLYDLYSNKKVSFDDCIVKLNDDISIAVNTIESASLEIELQNRYNRENILKNKLNTLTYEFDFVVIDNSPYLGVLVANSLSISDYYIEVIDNSTSSLQGLNMVNKAIENIKDNMLNTQIKSLGILKNRFDKRTSFTKQFSEVLEENYGDKLFTTSIPESIKYKEAIAVGQFIQEYSKEHAQPYEKIVCEILEKL